MGFIDQLRTVFPAMADAVRRMITPPIEPEIIEGDWDDYAEDFAPATQEIDLRMVRLEGLDVDLVVPSFDVFSGHNTDLYGAFQST